MSLMQSRQFTISTYDPPSTPIALKAQKPVPSRTKQRLSDSPQPSRRSAASEKAYFDSLKNDSANKTPEVNKKVLPWVNSVVTEGYEPPKGIFGPYDSRPPSRYNPNPPAQALPQRVTHPFAYNAQIALPLSALTSEIDVSKVLEEQAAQQTDRVEGSDILSRGAGLLERNAGERDSANSYRLGRDSVEMGTFGREASQDPVSSSEALPPVPPKSPAKTAKVHRKPAPSSPATIRDLGAGQREPDEAVPPSQPNVKIHHEHPFSPADALRKEAQAMAHVEALERLVGAVGPELVPTSHIGHKGPRETYETTTSVPSFGHLWHQDGMPLSRHISYDPAPDPLSPARLFHIPFGPNIGLRISGPDILFERHIAVGPELVPLNDSPEPGQRREDRSAYVETVQDEDEPNAVQESRSRASSRSTSRVTTEQAKRTHAGTESTAQPDKIAQPAVPPRQSEQPAQNKPSSPSTQTPRPGSSPPTGPKSYKDIGRKAVSTIEQGAASDSELTREADLMNHHYPVLRPMPHVKPAVMRDSGEYPSPSDVLHTRKPSNDFTGSIVETRGAHVRVPSRTSNQAQNGSSRLDDRKIPGLDSPASLFSASTTQSNVKHIVAESRFHDETLCQLLDAARLNLIGDEAKKALHRAARARVIELRDMRANVEDVRPEVEKKGRGKHRKHRSGPKESKSRKESDVTGRHPASARKAAGGSETPRYHQETEREHVRGPTAPAPDWAKEIMERLSAFDARFNEMEKQTTPEKGVHTRDVTQDMPVSMLNEMIFNTRREDFMASPNDDFPFGLAFPPVLSFPHIGIGADMVDTIGGAKIQTISSDEPRKTNETILSWGSNADIELPTADVRVTPPQREKVVPTINVQAPTESNIGKSLRNVSDSQTGTIKTGQSGPGQSSFDYRTNHPTAVPDPTERDLPPPPSESIRSHRPSPVSDSVHLPSMQARSSGDRGDTPISIREALRDAAHESTARSAHLGHYEPVNFVTVPDMMQPLVASSETTERGNTLYKTAVESLLGTPHQIKEKLTVNDPSADEGYVPNPWDLVTQRLYSWAVVWEDSTFSKAMEDISLNRQVGEFALTIFVMMTFKRMLKRSLSEVPHRVCDKLFVPPTFAEAINQAVLAQQYKAAQQMLEELWYPFLFKEPPRVIIALTRHLNDPDTWIAHRFDLSTGHLRSYRVTHEDQEHDGRPFRWWHAIRLAWPQYKIRDPMEMGQQTTTDWAKPEDKANNSLRALNIARNLFLGFRPEHPSDIGKLRESVWSEVKRLREKKRGGKLMVEMNSTGHS